MEIFQQLLPFTIISFIHLKRDTLIQQQEIIQNLMIRKVIH